jgi:flavodoxin
MKRVLVVYYSRTGMTKKMAHYIDEGLRSCQTYGRTLGKELGA